MLTTAVPIAEPDQAPATPDTTADTAAAPTCAFHISAAWFASWRSAYVPPDASPVTLCGVPMLADRARIGPIGYDRLRSQTNIHTARFDAPPGGPSHRGSMRYCWPGATW